MEVPDGEEDARMITRKELETKRSRVDVFMGDGVGEHEGFIESILSAVLVEFRYMNDRQDEDREKLAIRFKSDYKDSKAGFKPSIIEECGETKVGGTD